MILHKGRALACCFSSRAATLPAATHPIHDDTVDSGSRGPRASRGCAGAVRHRGLTLVARAGMPCARAPTPLIFCMHLGECMLPSSQPHPLLCRPPSASRARGFCNRPLAARVDHARAADACPRGWRCGRGSSSPVLREGPRRGRQATHLQERRRWRPFTRGVLRAPHHR